jgi:DNA-directed RNA polymerase beta' subunit
VRQGILVDVRHIMLVADMMCMDGEVKQIGRHGIAGEKESVLSRAAFEVTVNHLLDAAVANEVGKIIQFERIGFARIDRVSKDGIEAFFAHR